MKKKEIWMIAGIAVIAIVAILVMNFLPHNNTASNSSNSAPSENAKGQWVAIIHANKVEQWFDSGVDAEYEVTGDYGVMHVEVKDGKWHVGEVECPNHTCENMGWDDGNNFMPITCIPNNIMLCTEQWAENYLNNEQ